MVGILYVYFGLAIKFIKQNCGFLDELPFNFCAPSPPPYWSSHVMSLVSCQQDKKGITPTYLHTRTWFGQCHALISWNDGEEYPDVTFATRDKDDPHLPSFNTLWNEMGALLLLERTSLAYFYYIWFFLYFKS